MSNRLRSVLPNVMSLLPEKLNRALSELRSDFGVADQGKIRLGFAVTVAITIVTASGWPPGDVLQRGLFLVLVALPCAGIGLGLMAGEMIHARADRRGRRQADDREVEALRAMIAADPTVAARRASLDGGTVPSAREVISGDEIATVRRKVPPRPIYTPRRGYTVFRTGYFRRAK